MRFVITSVIVCFFIAAAESHQNLRVKEILKAASFIKTDNCDIFVPNIYVNTGVQKLSKLLCKGVKALARAVNAKECAPMKESITTLIRTMKTKNRKCKMKNKIEMKMVVFLHKLTEDLRNRNSKTKF